eukprot:scaffold72783_cov69-Phaeocystis_antarctica.AAC.1
MQRAVLPSMQPPVSSEWSLYSTWPDSHRTHPGYSAGSALLPMKVRPSAFAWPAHSKGVIIRPRPGEIDRHWPDVMATIRGEPLPDGACAGLRVTGAGLGRLVRPLRDTPPCSAIAGCRPKWGSKLSCRGQSGTGVLPASPRARHPRPLRPFRLPLPNALPPGRPLFRLRPSCFVLTTGAAGAIAAAGAASSRSMSSRCLAVSSATRRGPPNQVGSRLVYAGDESAAPVSCRSRCASIKCALYQMANSESEEVPLSRKSECARRSASISASAPLRYLGSEGSRTTLRVA